jgi:hypothetical protein
MDLFAWWPFEVLVLAQIGLGLALLLVLHFAGAPAEQQCGALGDLHKVTPFPRRKRPLAAEPGQLAA